MSFKSVLENVVSRLDGVLGVMVIAEDGIIVEREIPDENFDPELMGAEYIGGCRDIQRATEAVNSGTLEEVTVVSEKTTMLLRSISPGYFLLLLMQSGSSLGKPRYELKKASYELAPEFM